MGSRSCCCSKFVCKGRGPSLHILDAKIFNWLPWRRGARLKWGRWVFVGMHEVVPYVVHMEEPESTAAETEAVVVLDVRTYKE